MVGGSYPGDRAPSAGQGRRAQLDPVLLRGSRRRHHCAATHRPTRSVRAIRVRRLSLETDDLIRGVSRHGGRAWQLSGFSPSSLNGRFGPIANPEKRTAKGSVVGKPTNSQKITIEVSKDESHWREFSPGHKRRPPAPC